MSHSGHKCPQNCLVCSDFCSLWERGKSLTSVENFINFQGKELIFCCLKTWKCILYCFWYQSFRFLFRFSIALLGAAAEGEKANSNGGCLAQKTGLFAQIASSDCAAENLQLRRKKLRLTCFLILFIIVFKNHPKKVAIFFTARS